MTDMAGMAHVPSGEALDAITMRARDMVDLTTTIEGAQALADEVLAVATRAHSEGRLSLRLLDLCDDTALRLAAWLAFLEGSPAPVDCEVESACGGAACRVEGCFTCTATARQRCARCQN